MAKKIRKLVAAVIIASAVTAANAMDTGAYLGLDLGYSNTNNKSRAVPTPNGVVVSPNNTGIGGRIFLGNYVTDYFGLEGGLTHYASSNYKNPLTGDTASVHTQAFDFEGIGRYAVKNFGLGIYGKLGFAYLRAVQSRKLTVQGDSSNNSGLHPLIGAGVSYDITNHYMLDLSWTRVISRSSSLPSPNMIALGISYHFTTDYCGQFVC